MQDGEIDDALDDDGPIYPLVEHGLLSLQEQQALDRGDYDEFRALGERHEITSARPSLPGGPLEPSREFTASIERTGLSLEAALEGTATSFDEFCTPIGAEEQQRAILVEAFDDVSKLAALGDPVATGLVEKVLTLFVQRTPKSAAHFKQQLKRRTTLAEEHMFEQIIGW